MKVLDFNIAEYNKVKFMAYRDFCKYLQDKYGMPEKDYYTKAEEGHLKSTNKSRGSEGLQCHHICEDLVPSLSDKTVAANNDIMYQNKINLCYANLLEHMLLHIMIAEQKNDSNDVEEGTTVGTGGVEWMVLGLNAIYMKSRKDLYEFQNADKDAEDCKYDYQKVISNNYDVYLTLVNRYCTSAYIRLMTGSTPEQIALRLCRLSTKASIDKNNQVKIDILNAAKDTKLFDWNIQAYADIENYLDVKKERTAALYLGTGLGKSPTTLEYIRVHDCNALVLGPQNTIEESWINEKRVEQKYLDRITYMTYQSFANKFKTIDFSKYDIIVCDEVHHSDAPVWGKGLRYALANSNVKILGLTATLNDNQEKGLDDLFEGRICYGLDITEALKQEIIWPFSYIQSEYGIDPSKLPGADSERGKLLKERLDLSLNKKPICETLRDKMPAGVRKAITFIPSTKEENEAVKAILDSGLFTEENIRIIHSKKDSDYIKETKEWFNTTNDKNICLITVNMVNEGAHYEGINTLIMLRKTNSNILYMQQIGRLIVLMSRVKQDPNGIVFDFTNNVANLVCICNQKNTIKLYADDEENSENNEKDRVTPAKIISALREIEKTRASAGIIVDTIDEDTLNMLIMLKECSKANYVTNLIYKEFLNEDLQLTNCIKLELWKNLKVNNSDIKKIDMNKKPTNKTLKNMTTRVANKKLLAQNTVDASDAQKIAKAYLQLARYLYNFKIINFTDQKPMSIEVYNESEFKRWVDKIGFIDPEQIKTVLNNQALLTWSQINS